ncbi:MAG: ACT domain-containing protein [Gammaproteobacteria bacterium]
MKNPRQTSQQQSLVISVLGENRQEVLHGITRYIRDSGCNVIETRTSTMGRQITIMCHAEGSWDSLARFESGMEKLAEKLGVKLVSSRTDARAFAQEMVPYAIDAVCIDQPGVLHELITFCANREISISELSARAYTALNTGTGMFAMQLAINVPAQMHIATLREEFMEFCDQLNIDAILEPIKQ